MVMSQQTPTPSLFFLSTISAPVCPEARPRDNLYLPGAALETSEVPKTPALGGASVCLIKVTCYTSSATGITSIIVVAVVAGNGLATGSITVQVARTDWAEVSGAVVNSYSAKSGVPL